LDFAFDFVLDFDFDFEAGARGAFCFLNSLDAWKYCSARARDSFELAWTGEITKIDRKNEMAMA
jgi:hypothetical protein